ncbi:cytochrome P450 [Serendipita vermifera]|nr:cytochrome P450 [Serendipita vermifera]
MNLPQPITFNLTMPSFIESPAKSGIVALIAVGLGYLVLKALQTVVSGRAGIYSYPPGPPRDFLIGTLRSFPKGSFAEHFCDWARTYGDIVYAPIPGMSIVILNSHDIAQELLAKRPSLTAGRRVGYLMLELMGWKWSVGFQQPGPRHSNQRKMLRRAIGRQRAESHGVYIESEVATLLTLLESFQGDPNDMMQACIGRIVSRITYGDQIWKDMGGELSRWNIEAQELANEAFNAFWLVDMINFLRFIPDWVPGLRFKQITREARPITDNICHAAYQRGLKLRVGPLVIFFILNDLLDEFGDCEDVQDTAAILYTVSVDTTGSGTILFLYTLFLFPKVAERIFEEIQSVTQGLRLPHVRDQARLPYTEAVWKEVVRWRPPMPLGIPHVNIQDEIIRGHVIPKGTIIHQNNQMMFSDPAVWGDPEVFRPERFLEPEASQRPNPVMTQFGWGIRICPGMYLAERIVLHMIAAIISVYKLEPLEGHVVPDPHSAQYTAIAVQRPADFRCRFTVRNEKAQGLLNGILLAH